MKKLLSIIISFALLFTLVSCTAEQLPTDIGSDLQQSDNTALNKDPVVEAPEPVVEAPKTGFDLSEIPAFSGKAYVSVNGNQPFFTDAELTAVSFERYSELDAYGRCGTAFASIGRDIMPTEERGSIGSVKPSGWQTVKYDCVDGKYLYNRCHLIGFQLSGENANTRNLITGTRFMNISGMLPFENMTADYVKETGNHVLYRVTPVYIYNNLVASGVLMEAKSVEDGGDGILFCVYCYNCQPEVTIDYLTGDSSLTGGGSSQASDGATDNTDDITADYVMNTNSKKFHTPKCSSGKRISDANRKKFSGSRDELIADGYSPCKICKP